MRHPHKWGQGVKVTFSFSVSLGCPEPRCIQLTDLACFGTNYCVLQYVLDTCLAIIGILMFGDDISEAITSNIIKTSGYPETLTVFMCICIAIIPLTKIPLNARPLITTADVVCGLHLEPHHHHATARSSAWSTTLYKYIVRIVVVLVLLGISILFPAFDSVCAFLGAALCSLISIILPLSFYLKLYWKEISFRERVVSWILLVLFSIMGLLGTIWTFLPKSLVGA